MFASPKTNLLIPELITNFKDYDKNFSNRIKVDNLLMSFNDDANRNFTKFVDLSNKRYKSIKSGNTLNNILGKQMPTYNKLNKEINNNEIYSTTELEEDKKKLGKSVNKFKTKELNAIREQLKDSLRDFSKAELRQRENLLKKVMEKRRLQELESINRNPKSYTSSTMSKYKINETIIKRSQSKEPTYITSSSDNNNEKNPIVEGEQICKK
jgi:hypothetical protein